MVMRILFFTKGDARVASSNERVWIVSRYLREHFGIESDVVSARGLSLRSAYRHLFRTSYDVLVVHKSLFSKGVFALLLLAKMFRRVPFVYDLDDAQWVHSRFKSMALARVADAVFAGSHYIMEWASQYNRHVIHLPTLVDHGHFAKYRATHGSRERYTIGWVGGVSEHFRRGNLQLLRAPLDAVGKRYPLRFVVVGKKAYAPLEEYFKSPHFELVIAPFVPYVDVPKQIQQFDVGVMPLQDTPFERAKCAAKAIQYMACGVPPVVSPVGENRYVVEDGVNGFLADGTDEWVEKIIRLLDDAELRKRFGNAGAEKVMREYSHDAVLKRYVEELKHICGA